MPTNQQQTIINTAKKLFDKATIDNSELLKVSAISGAGKTFTLVKLTEKINPKTGLYLAYNKSISVEAEEKFKHLNIKAQTIHSLAYRATVSTYHLKVGVNIKPRDIKGGLDYLTAIEIVDVIEDFCLSKFTTFKEYTENIQEKLSDIVIKNVENHLEKMADGRATASHSFYLKLYHILLANGKIKPPEVDIILLDEAGDLTELTLEIFKLLKAKLKVMVGDPSQNIYSFNKTINGFHAMAKEGTSCKLTESFRVNNIIAQKVETFMKKYVGEDFEFKGQIYKNYTIKTKAYLARTNAGLIEKMNELRLMGIPFNLSRPPNAIFGAVLTLMSINNGKPIQNQNMRYLEKDVKKYNKLTPIEKSRKSLTAYILEEHSKDKEIRAAINLINKFSPGIIWKIFEFVKGNYSRNGTYETSLTSSHSSKGLEWDSVTILPDANEAVKVAIEAYDLFIKQNKVPPPLDHPLYQEINLYYVATTRCLYELHDATFLQEPTKKGSYALFL